MHIKRILETRISPIFFAPEGAEGGGMGTEKPHVGDDAKKFAKKFTPPDDVLLAAGLPITQQEEPVVKAPPKEGEQPTPEAKLPVKPIEQGGPFIKKLIAEKKAAEKDRDDAIARAQKFEKEEKVQLEGKISELQKKIDSGSFSTVREKEFQDKIDALVNEKQKSEETLTRELQSRDERLSFYNMQEDPNFVKDYVAPVVQSRDTMVSVIKGSHKAVAALQSAMSLNRQALETTNEDDKSEFQKQRDVVIEEIIESLPRPTQSRFLAAYDSFLAGTEKHFAALQNHVQVTQEIRQKAQRKGIEHRTAESNRWKSAFDEASTKFSKDLELTPEVEAKIKELGITLDPAADEALARSAYSTEVDPKQIIEVLQRGKAYGVLKARLAATEAINKELMETVERLKGGGTPGSGAAGVIPPKRKEGEVVNNDGKSRADWQRDRFAAPGSAARSR